MDLSIPRCDVLRFRPSEQRAKKEIISLCQRRRGKPQSLKNNNKKKKQTRLSLLVSLQQKNKGQSSKGLLVGLKKHGQSQRDTSGYQGPKTHLSYPGDADIDTKKTLGSLF